MKMKSLINTMFYILIDECSDFDKYQYLLNRLPCSKRQKIGTYRDDIDKKLSLFSDLLVRSYVCNLLHIDNSELAFAQNPYGKPMLLNYPFVKYNISHTRNAIIIAFSDDEIGVDIERIRSYDLGIARRFFSQNEYSYILDNNSHNRFVEIWTRKEAYVKWLGKGLYISLSSFDVFDTEISKGITTFYIGDYVISVCGIKDFKSDDVIVMNEEMAKQYIDSSIV